MPGQPDGSAASEPSQVTLLLNRMQKGDRDAGEQVVEILYDELHRIASREMRREREGHTLQTTALVNEAFIRLIGSGSLEIHSRGHFFSVASQQMRRILVDYARSGRAQKRGGGAIILDLDQVPDGARTPGVDILLLNDCLEDLERLDPRAAKVVELRYFGGYTDKEVVEALNVSLATVRRDWEFARSWLFNQVRGNPGSKAAAPPLKARKNE